MMALGAVKPEKVIWLEVVLRVWPAPAAKFTVAPGVRVNVPNESVAGPPVPAVLWIVEFPEAKLTLPRVCAEARPAAPVKATVPPLSVSVADALTRLLRFAVAV